MRLIDADALDMYEHLNSYYGDAWRDAQEEIDNAPTVDAVPTEALRLFVNWAEECGFGYDNMPEQYERYKDRLANMGYIEGLMHIAMWEAERKEE